MMLKKKLLLLALGLQLGIAGFAQQKTAAPTKNCQVTIDLTQVKNDKVMVTVLAPAIMEQETIYNMPKIVPGTYSISDFGRFVSEFKAFDKAGRALAVEKLDTNRWKIANAATLHRITYWVDDTFDAAKKGDAIFEPGGTNIEEDKNFLINTFGFIGYFEGLKQIPYELTITKPEGFYGSTPLQAVSTTATADRYLIQNYVELADAPLMYNRPDTSIVNIGKTEVLVSVYSPSKRVTSKPIAENVKGILEAQRSYLGGTLPVDKYAFIIYVPEKAGKSGSYGALEHSYSSVYFLPEMPEQQFSSTMRDVAAHEFFHIVTPLSVHSEEIAYFDFINPKMSKHLWMYEGVTEYFASHVQRYEGLFTTNDFMQKIRDYIANSRTYYNDTLPFTVMSANVLDEYADQYGNVYQKGALIGMALDIRLRELSNGEYGLRNLMLDLSKTYGKDKPFQDDTLFDTITELTFPQIREFFSRYVEGSEPLPLQETFSKVGISYEPVAVERVNSYGGFIPGYDREADKITVAETREMDAFGKKMGFKIDDQLLTLNGQEITPLNVKELFSTDLQRLESGSPIEIVVGRKNARGKIKKKKLKGVVTTQEKEIPHVLKPASDATEQQQRLRAAWLNEA
ncbi:peptidase M61 [Pontibacter sp. SGAir0037]|uniref:M61 family metallopeptidase n=1 Tax=Pontibacter sp. SGAir0037 TaxID=2571030 RepID=UPI0010CD49E4|nr:peptidase M61 [Pontibacter sp. SGAir0037]QCR21262.1 peptidase M61 [Pontibacter sp. SGAir0037]